MRHKQPSKLSDGVTDVATLFADMITNVIGFPPVMGPLMQFARATQSIRDALYFDKLSRILAKLEDIETEERTVFLENLGPEGRERFQENLLLIVDRLDAVEKADIIGCLYRAAFRDLIKHKDAERLSSIVNRTYFSDLAQLHIFLKEHQGNDPDVTVSLHAAGLLKVTRVDENESPSEFYVLSNYGRMLLEHGLNGS